MTTGFYSGRFSGRSKVHYVASDGPLCGSRHSGEYQVCNNGPHASILECRRCESALKRIHSAAAMQRPKKRGVR